MWTKKAEMDYRAKYPHRKNERKEGTRATWYGNELSKSFIEGYAERGWIVAVVQNKPAKIKLQKKSEASMSGCKMTIEQKHERWNRLKYYFGQPNNSIEDIAIKLGLRSHGSLNEFVRRYGPELAKSYGKLPYRCGLRMSAWAEVMEEKVGK